MTKPWILWFFRVTVTLEIVLGLLQAAFAGSFLSGDYGALNMHAVNAGMLGTVAILMTVAAVLVWRPGGGPAWPALACGILVVAETVQTVLGYGRALAVHVPLGVSIIAAIALMFRWAWWGVDERPAPLTAEPEVAVKEGV